MRNAVLAGALLGCVTLAQGQEVLPGRGYAPGAQPAATSDAEARYLQLVEAASRLDAAGRSQEATSVRRQAERQRQALLEHLARLQAEVDRLRRLTGTAPQILVQVCMMEFSRTKLRALGFDFTKIEGHEKAEAASNEIGSYRARVVDDARPLLRMLEAMREDKLLRVLAEPTLAVVSGHPAAYNVGGEFPVPTPTTAGGSAIEYRHYGTRVDLTADVLGGSTIRLKIRTRCSELDPQRSVDSHGVTVPGLRVREVDTGVQLESGQTLVLTGLAQNRIETVRRKPAIVGALPGVGDLLARTEEKHDEVEMIVLVTARIVPPKAALQARRPTQRPLPQAPLGLQYDLRR